MLGSGAQERFAVGREAVVAIGADGGVKLGGSDHWDSVAGGKW